MDSTEDGKSREEVAVRAPSAGSEKRFSYTEDQKKLVLGRQVPPHTHEEDLKYFWTVAEARGLDPFCDYLYGDYENDAENPDAGSFKVHPTLAGYRFKAEQTGEYLGTTTPSFCAEDGRWTETWFSSDPPAACKVGVRRQGFGEPQFHVVLMKDWMKQAEVNPYWKLSPEMSLAARAETGALKKAFPTLGGGVTMEERVDPGILRQSAGANDIVIVGSQEPGAQADRTDPAGGVPEKPIDPNGKNLPAIGKKSGDVTFAGVAFDAVIPFQKEELRGSTFGMIKSAQFQSLARKHGASVVQDNGSWKAALQAVLSELASAGEALKGTSLVATEPTKIAGKEIRLPLDTLRGLRLGALDLNGTDPELAQKVASESVFRLPLGASEVFLGEFDRLREQEGEKEGKRNGTSGSLKA